MQKHKSFVLAYLLASDYQDISVSKGKKCRKLLGSLISGYCKHLIPAEVVEVIHGRKRQKYDLQTWVMN